MIRALIWKEYREHRWTLIGLVTGLVFLKLGFGIIAREAIQQGDFSYDRISMMIAFLIGPVYTVILGASTLAHEMGKGTITLLLTRPVHRSRIFWIKTTVALAFLAAGCLAITLTFNDHAGFGWDWATARLILLFPLLLTFVFMLFGCSVLASHYCQGVLPALLLGGALSTASFYGIVFFRLEEAMPFVQLALGAASLGIAYLLFTRRQTSSLKCKVKFGLKGALIAAVVIYLGLHGWNQVLRACPGQMAVYGMADTPHGLALQGMVTRKKMPHGMQTRPFLVPAGTNEARWWNTKRNAEFATWSPDGRHVALIDQANHWGFYRREERMLICTNQGTVIHHGTAGFIREAVWNRKGDTLAYKYTHIRGMFDVNRSDEIHLVNVASPGPRIIPFTVDSKKQLTLLWFNDQGTAILCQLYDRDKGTYQLIELNLDGRTTVIDHPKPVEGLFTVGSPAPGTYLLISTYRQNRWYYTWKNGTFTPLCTVNEDWSMEALSSDGKIALFTSLEDLATGYERRGRLFWRDRELKLSIAIANVQAVQESGTTGETSGQAGGTDRSIGQFTGLINPAEGNIIFSKIFRDLGTRTVLPVSCWSEREKAFFFTTDFADESSTIYRLDPDSPEPQPFMKFR